MTPKQIFLESMPDAVNTDIEIHGLLEQYEILSYYEKDGKMILDIQALKDDDNENT
jgi:hypothetical protein